MVPVHLSYLHYSFSNKTITIWQKIFFFWFHVTVAVHCQLSSFLRTSVSCTVTFLPFFPPKFHQIAQNVAQTKPQHCWKGSNLVNLVLYVSDFETRFRLKNSYSKSTQKSGLRAAPLFWVSLELIWNELIKCLNMQIYTFAHARAHMHIHTHTHTHTYTCMHTYTSTLFL